VNGSYRFGRFELNPATRQLLADGNPVSLGARAFDVLVALVERRERMVTKDELMQIAWPGLVVEENNLDVQISVLRKAIGQEAIATVRGRGYRFAFAVLPENTAQPEQAPVAADPAAVPQPHRRSQRTIWIIGSAVAAVALAIAGIWYSSRPTVTEAGSTTQWPDAKSIAVLPFTNMSDDKDAAYFADGVQDDLRTQLALLGDLKIVSRTSVAEYRESRKNARQIAAELGVASLVEGSVRREGNRVRVSAQLIDARSDKHIWASSYDRELKDIFAIQSEVATEIARALKVSLTPKEQERLTRRPTENVAAYDLLQQHWSLVQRAGGASFAEVLPQRIALLARAVELDPKFALAWARLSSEHARMDFYGYDRSDARSRQAQHAIDRALALAPDDPVVRSELGNYYYYGLRDFPRAADYLEGVLQVAPNHVEILVQLAWVRRRQGLWIEANTLLSRALAIDSRNLDALRSLGENFRTFRHWNEALDLQRKIAALRPHDLDVQAELHFLAWSRSGSFDTYDAWRKTLPADAGQRLPRVWYMDISRAAARHDLDTIVGLLEMKPQATGFLLLSDAKELRAFVLLARGDRARALELAQTLQREALAELKRQPDDLRWLGRSLVAHAMLGHREAAWADYERWRTLLVAHPDALHVGAFLGFRASLHAMLGDRDLALQVMQETLKQQRGTVWGYWPHDLSLMSLWDDSRFVHMANDPANHAPIPIANWDLPAMLKTK
jgi:TolB-like protein/DNA-binding winged helix-turn-helix (wHTH) protein